jgi:hypothetical protein
MNTRRDKFYDRIAEGLSGMGLRTLPTRSEWEDALDRQKAYTLDALKARQCAMTFEGAAKVSGGINPNTGTPTGRFQLIMGELVDEGLLERIHMPNADDLYRAVRGPEGPADLTVRDYLADIKFLLEAINHKLQ